MFAAQTTLLIFNNHIFKVLYEICHSLLIGDPGGTEPQTGMLRIRVTLESSQISAVDLLSKIIWKNGEDLVGGSLAQQGIPASSKASLMGCIRRILSFPNSMYRLSLNSSSNCTPIIQPLARIAPLCFILKRKWSLNSSFIRDQASPNMAPAFVPPI